MNDNHPKIRRVVESGIGIGGTTAMLAAKIQAEGGLVYWSPRSFKGKRQEGLRKKRRRSV